MGLYGWMPLTHHTAKFGDHKHCNSRDMTFLICRVISGEYIIKESCDLMVGSPSWYVTTLPSLVAIDIMIEGLKESCDFMSGGFSP